MMGASTLAGGGVLVATPSVNRDTSLVKTMARAEGLIVRPRAPNRRPGEACRITDRIA
jgi:hypothetical protein